MAGSRCGAYDGGVFLGIRLVILCLGIVLGLVLLARGAIVVGALVLAMALLRLVLIAGRRRAFRGF